jgi:hypothetical protein
MPGLFVTALDAAANKTQAVTTDKAGRFRFGNLEQKPYDLSVQFWKTPPGAPALGKRDVWPGRGEVELVASFDAPKKLAPGSVRGRVEDAGRRLATPASLKVLLVTDNRSWRTNAKLDGAAFAFADVEPGGPLKVVVMSGDDPILAGEAFELAPAEAKDLGTLVTQPGGSLRVRLERGAGAEGLEPTLYLLQAGCMHGRKVLPGKAREVLVENLTPGVHSLTLYGTGVTRTKEEVTIGAGVEATATLRLRPAVQREILVEYPAGQALQRIHVEEAGGAVFFDYRPSTPVARPYSMQMTFAAREVHVRGGDGERLGEVGVRDDVAGGGAGARAPGREVSRWLADGYHGVPARWGSDARSEPPPAARRDHVKEAAQAPARRSPRRGHLPRARPAASSS